MRIATLLLPLLVALSACSQPEPTLNDGIPQSLPRQTLQLQAAQGEAQTLNVQVAQTDFERAKGLMFVTTMPENEGMLFVFPTAEYRAFWMRNTLIPLDVIYIKQNTVVNVVPWAKPHDESSLPSSGPADKVIEVNGGWAARHGIGAGSILTFSKQL